MDNVFEIEKKTLRSLSDVHREHDLGIEKF